MTRDRKIVAAVIAAISIALLGAATLATWVIGRGGSQAWRWPFRLVCHGMPERSLELFGTTMPLCARCVGIYVGLLLGLAAFVAAWAVREKWMRIVALVAVTPLAVDGLTQLAGLRESTNPLRLATGLLAGLAFGMWVLSAIERHGDDARGTS